jgi:hypothetical protein
MEMDQSTKSAERRYAMTKVAADKKLDDAIEALLRSRASTISKLTAVALSNEITEEDYRRAQDVLHHPQGYDDASILAASVVCARWLMKKYKGKKSSVMEYLKYTKRE